MEVKLQQQLAWVDQEPLYQIYLDLRKAYDALDRGQCFKIIAGYGVGPNLLCLRCVARVVIMVYLLGLIAESHRGGHFPASCSMCVLTVS
jgi:hypothetical protein